MKEGEQTADLLMYVALKTLKKQIDLEFEKKMGLNNVDLFVQELKREEEEKLKAKQRKSEKKAKQKARKKLQQKENNSAAVNGNHSNEEEEDENEIAVTCNNKIDTKTDNVLKASTKDRNNCNKKNNMQQQQQQQLQAPPLFDFSQRLNLIKLYDRVSPESEDELRSDEAIPLEDIEDYRKNEDVYKRKIRELHSRLEMDWQTLCGCGCMPNKMCKKSEE